MYTHTRRSAVHRVLLIQIRNVPAVLLLSGLPVLSCLLAPLPAVRPSALLYSVQGVTADHDIKDHSRAVQVPCPTGCAVSVTRAERSAPAPHR